MTTALPGPLYAWTPAVPELIPKIIPLVDGVFPTPPKALPPPLLYVEVASVDQEVPLKISVLLF